MTGTLIEDTAGTVGQIIELVGVAVIAFGILIITIAFFARLRAHPAKENYRRYRQGLGRTILLGLEFLVAGDIIRTVAVTPTLTSVGVLAVIVAIRTFLSLSLEVELEGRWPWARSRRAGSEAASQPTVSSPPESRPE